MTMTMTLTQPTQREPADTPGDYRAQKEDLTAALRWAAHVGLNEGVCNHFSMEVGPDRYLINPQGMHWGEVCVRDMLLIDGQGRVLDGLHALEATAFFIHSWIHRLNPRAKVVLHTHMPYATALGMLQGGRLAWAHQNALRYWDRVAHDDHYRGLALDAEEGERIARSMADKDVLFMANHGVTVIGASMAWAFDDLYYLERACMHQTLAMQASGGQPLQAIAPEVCRATALQIKGERQQSDLYFAAIKRLLDRDQAGWRATD